MSSFGVQNTHTNIEEMENHWVIDKHGPIGITSFDSRSPIRGRKYVQHHITGLLLLVMVTYGYFISHAQ